MQSLLLVGLAGGLGAMARFGVAILAERYWGAEFAFGTLIVNVTGCFALGFLLELERGTEIVSYPVRLLVAVGFLGAFTTFSTFGYETLRFLQSGATQTAALNILANLVLGLVAVWFGFLIARNFHGV
ncbi:MAG: CrcB protein [Candidatus Krumholzibacteriia bacterium]